MEACNIFLQGIVVMDYMTAREASEKWGITQRRVQILCAQGKIAYAVPLGTA